MSEFDRGNDPFFLLLLLAMGMLLVCAFFDEEDL